MSFTDPLTDLCLVPLRKDVDVRLKRAGLYDSFVPGRPENRGRIRMRTAISQKGTKELLIINLETGNYFE